MIQIRVIILGVLATLGVFGLINCFIPQKGPQDFNHGKALIVDIFITKDGDTAIVLKSKNIMLEDRVDTFYIRKNN